MASAWSGAVNQRATLPLSSSVAGYPRDTRVPQALTAAPPGFVSYVLACMSANHAARPCPRLLVAPAPSLATCMFPLPILHRRQLWLRHPHFPPPSQRSGPTQNSKPLFLSFSRIKSRLSFHTLFNSHYFFWLLILLYLDWQAPQSLRRKKARPSPFSPFRLHRDNRPFRVQVIHPGRSSLFLSKACCVRLMSKEGIVQRTDIQSRLLRH